MESIEERAKSYVEGCELQGKEARKAEFDYIAGAKEERILLTEHFESWLADMVCEGVFETSNLPYAIERFKADFKVEPTEKYYGDDDSPNIYTVWVGGTEVTDNLLPKYKAERIADDWRKRGYDDVVVESYE
jgi:hypothetical protein